MVCAQGDGAFPASRAMHHDGGNLTILHLAQDDGGHYECVASNQVANAITTTLLLIESTAAGFCYHTHTHTHTRLTALFPGLPK